MRVGAAVCAVGLTMAFAAGCGGHAGVRALPSGTCGALVYHGPGKPDVLVVSDLPLRNPPDAAQQPAGVERVLAARHYRAGRLRVGYQSCDDSSARTGAWDPARCTANAHAYAEDASLVGIVGPFNSGCAANEIPILDRASGGPVPMIGTATTDPTLTAAVPGAVGVPGMFYPAHVRNFVRLTAPDQFQSAALAMLARKLGLHRVAVVDDGDPYGVALGRWFVSDARRLGVGVAGRFTWDQHGKSFDLLSRRVAAAQPDGVFLAGYVFLHGDAVLRSLRTRLPAVKVLAPDGFADPATLQRLGSAANGLLFVVAGVPPRGTATMYLYGRAYGAAAARALLDAIAASDGSRASVRRALFHTRIPAGTIGAPGFGFDADGDPTTGAVTVFRFSGSRVSVDSTLYPTGALAKGAS